MAAHKPVTRTPAYLAALGTATDRLIAERFDVSLATVHASRRHLGIPSHRRTSKGDRIEALLDVGGLSDSEISRRTGVDRAAIRRRREARGVGNQHADRAQVRLDAVLAYKTAHPSASVRAIAQAVGVGKSRVAKILKDHRAALRVGRAQVVVAPKLDETEIAYLDGYLAAYRADGGKRLKTRDQMGAASTLMDSHLNDAYIYGMGSRAEAWWNWTEALKAQGISRQAVQHEARRIFYAIDSVTTYS